MKETNLERDWDFEAGRLPLDFANTQEWRTSAQPREMLNNYTDLVAWSWQAGLMTDNEVQTLLSATERNPMKATEALEKAIELREAIYRIFSNTAKGQAPRSTDLAYLNTILSEAGMRAQIVQTSNGFRWGWIADEGSFDQMLWPIARSAADLLASEDLERVGECADDRGCSWLFFDTSRNRSRRWCSMESCGNRAKARRHYRRQAQKHTEKARNFIRDEY